MKEYRGNCTLLIVAVLFVIPLLLSPTTGVVEDATINTPFYTEFETSDIDLDRVDWAMNQYESPGFEQWNNPHSPLGVDTSRTTEHFTGYSTSNYSEGSQSAVLQVKAVDSNYPAEALLRPDSWTNPLNPVNLTVSFDWNIDLLPDSIDANSFKFEIELKAFGTRYLTYYLGCENTVVQNSTYYHHYMIEEINSGWNSFSRNITEDFFDMVGAYPTEFEYFRFELYSGSTDYSRVFIDDLNIVNGSVMVGDTTNNGNFESTAYWTRWNNDPSDIIQSTERVEGEFSLNATSISNGNKSNGHIYSRPDKRVTSENVDLLKFQWNMKDFVEATEDTYAYVSVDAKNDTHEFHVYYPLCYGGPEFPLSYSGYHVINPTGFNTTNQWNQFERSIWNDITAYNSTSFLIIESIEIVMYTEETGARITILFDDITYTCANLNDMDYENQGIAGDEVWAWDTSTGTDPHFTVTDLAHSGFKAGNITAGDDDSWGGEQEFGYLPVNNESDIWIDFWWRFENFTGLADDLVYLEVSLDDSENFAYIFGNGSSVYTGNGFDEFIIVPDNGTEGSWFNFQRNIYDDYVMLHGVEPDTLMYQLYLNVEADTGGRVEFLLDDVYLYNDPAPEIMNLYEASPAVETDEDVEITVDVIDLSLDTVTLHYSLDTGPWTTLEMNLKSGNTFNTSIPGQDYLTEVQYYVSANDTFGNVVDSLVDLSLNYTYVVTDTIDPTISIDSPDHEDTVGGIVAIVIDVNDVGSGINRVEIFIEGELVANLTSGPYSYNWDTTSLANGTYSITAKTYDEAENSAQVSHNVLVQNAETSTTTTTPTTPLEGDLTILLIAAGIVGAVAVIVVLYIVMKRGRTT